jgi:hypothetical protein
MIIDSDTYWWRNMESSRNTAPTKTLKCIGREGILCSPSGTRRVTLDTNSVINRKLRQDWIDCDYGMFMAICEADIP